MADYFTAAVVDDLKAELMVAIIYFVKCRVRIRTLILNLKKIEFNNQKKKTKRTKRKCSFTGLPDDGSMKSAQ